MSAVTALLLALAAACLALAVAHLAMWLPARSERTQLWAAISFSSGGAVSVIMAFGERGSDPYLWHPVVFTISMVLTSLAIHAAIRSAFAALHMDLRSWRGVGLWAVTITQAIVNTERSIAVFDWPAGATPPTWEPVMTATPLYLQAPFWGTAALTGIAVAIDATRSRRARGGLAWVLCGVAVSIVILAIVRLSYMDLAYMALATACYALFMFARLSVLALRGMRGADPLSGIERYRKLHRLGAGGMGEAWLAVRSGERGFHRLVVIKHMREPDAGAGLERFLAEARLAARLNHRSIVAVFDVGKTADGWYIVMEYLSGLTLTELAGHAKRTRRRLPHDLIAAIGVELGRALAHAHEAGVVHRDVSPDNIVVTFDGAVKVIDFGIAKPMLEPEQAAGPAGPAPLTQTGKVIGKEAYMAPERLRGEPATPASDIFALSVVLFELLTGGRPSLGAELCRHPAFDELLAAAGAGAFAQVLRRGLAARADDRFASGAGFSVALERLRRDLEPVHLEDWIREAFPERAARERVLVAMTDPSPEEVASVIAAAVPAPARDEAETVPVRSAGHRP